MAGLGFSGPGSDWDFSKPRFDGVETGTGLTTRQLLQLLHASKQKPKRSFASSLKHLGEEALDPVLWSLDKLMRPTYAIASGVQAVNRGGTNPHIGKGEAHYDSIGDLLSTFAGGARRGFTGKNKIGLGEVLKEEGVLEGHARLRGLAAFGMEVGSDPLNLATLGTVPAARNLAVRAGDDILRDTIGILSKKEASEALKKNKSLQQVLAPAGEKFTHRTALADTKSELLRKLSFGADITDAERMTLNTARAAAEAEAVTNNGKVFGIGVRGPGGRRAMLPLPIPAPRAESWAKLPVVGGAAAALGKAFVPGYGDPVTHAALMSRKHAGEELASKYLEFTRKSFEGVSHLDDEAQRAALHWFEKPGGVIMEGERAILNPKRIEEAKKAGLSDEQLQFAKAQHDVSEYLYGQHKAMGLDIPHLGREKGQLYIPHAMMNDGTPLADRYRNMLTERGFRKERKNAFTLREMEKMKKAGSLPKNVETSPFRLMALHSRSVANQHADQSVLNYAARHLGRGTRLTDSSAIRAAEKELEKTLGVVGAHGANQLPDLQEDLKGIIKEHEDRVLRSYSEGITRREAQIREHLDRDHSRTTMATVTRISNRNKRAKESIKAELAAIRKGKHPEVAKAIEARKAEREAVTAEHRALEKKARDLENQVKKLRKGKKNPDAKGDWVTVDRLKDEHGHPIQLPPEIAEPILRMQRVLDGDNETITGFVNAYRRLLGKWKLGVTSVNPGYGVRNTLSDAWNMWISGVPFGAMVVYGGRAGALMRAAKNGDPKAVSTLMDAYQQGVLSGLFQGDVQQIQGMLQHAGSKRALARRKKPIALGAKIAQDINRNRENWGRLTHYLYRLDTEQSVAKAARWVKMAHFDYEDLTPFEQKVMKSVAPFYTWSRKNVPYQIRQVFENPGRYSAFPKFAMEMEAASSKEEQNQIVPDYMRKGMYLRIPGVGLMAPMIGVTDLQKANPMNIRDTATQLASPIFKVPAEIAMNQSMLTGRPIVDPSGHPRNPVNDKLAGLLSLLPGSNVGVTQRAGKRGAGIDPRYSYLFSQLPATNALINNTGEIKGRGKTLAYLTGINVSSPDQDMAQRGLVMDEEDAFAGYLRGLRDEGLVPEPKQRKKSAAQKQLEELLIALAEGR